MALPFIRYSYDGKFIVLSFFHHRNYCL
jgi:hypothetical protein